MFSKPLKHLKLYAEQSSSRSREGLPLGGLLIPAQERETLVEMRDVCVRYGDKPALGEWSQEVEGQERKGLWWTIRRGERWGVFGPNGKSLIH